MCDGRLFAPQIAAIRDRAVMVAPVANGDTIATIAAEVLRVAPARFALAGLSMGGIVAMEMMAQRPHRIAGLCLMDTNALAESEEVAAAREPQIERVRSGGLRDVMRNEMKPNYLADGPHRGAILDTCLEMAEDHGWGVFVRQSRALQVRMDRQDVLRAVAVPSLVLCGREDRLCPLEGHELMRDLIPGARLAVVEGAGHLPVLERPKETNAHLREWLSAVDAT